MQIVCCLIAAVRDSEYIGCMMMKNPAEVVSSAKLGQDRNGLQEQRKSRDSSDVVDPIQGPGTIGRPACDSLRDFGSCKSCESTPFSARLLFDD